MAVGGLPATSGVGEDSASRKDCSTKENQFQVCARIVRLVAAGTTHYPSEWVLPPIRWRHRRPFSRIYALRHPIAKSCKTGVCATSRATNDKSMTFPSMLCDRSRARQWWHPISPGARIAPPCWRSVKKIVKIYIETHCSDSCT